MMPLRCSPRASSQASWRWRASVTAWSRWARAPASSPRLWARSPAQTSALATIARRRLGRGREAPLQPPAPLLTLLLHMLPSPAKRGGQPQQRLPLARLVEPGQGGADVGLLDVETFEVSRANGPSGTDAARSAKLRHQAACRRRTAAASPLASRRSSPNSSALSRLLGNVKTASISMGCKIGVGSVSEAATICGGWLGIPDSAHEMLDLTALPPQDAHSHACARSS